MNARRFELHRDVDESGVSGTGVVAEGIEFTSGMIALTWYGTYHGVTVYENIKTVKELHGHHGKTRIVFVDAEEA